MLQLKKREDCNGYIRYTVPNGVILEKIYGLTDDDPDDVEKEVEDYTFVTLAEYYAELKLGVENSEGARSDFDSVVENSI